MELIQPFHGLKVLIACVVVTFKFLWYTHMIERWYIYRRKIYLSSFRVITWQRGIVELQAQWRRQNTESSHLQTRTQSRESKLEVGRCFILRSHLKCQASSSKLAHPQIFKHCHQLGSCDPITEPVRECSHSHHSSSDLGRLLLFSTLWQFHTPGVLLTMWVDFFLNALCYATLVSIAQISFELLPVCNST